MRWIYLAITAHFLWAWVNIGDKYVVDKRIKNPLVYYLWLCIISAWVVILIPLAGLSLPGPGLFALLFLAAFFGFLGALPYFKALQLEEISRINIWWQFIPIFSLLIGFLVLGQRLNQFEVAAFIILILGGALASIRVEKGKFKMSKAVIYMLLSGLFYGAYAVTLNKITETFPVFDAWLWVNLFFLIFAPLLLLSENIKNDFKRSWQGMTKSLFMVLVGVIVVDNLASLLNVWALSQAYGSLVFAMEGWQMLFVFLIALVLSIFYPRIIKEDLSAGNLILKIASLLLMITGILILNI